jgi:hypothetical protein
MQEALLIGQHLRLGGYLEHELLIESSYTWEKEIKKLNS